MSIPGIIHTVFSVAAILFSIPALIKEGVINPVTKTGRYYSVFTSLACFTAFGLSKAGGFNFGHALGIVILLLLGLAYFLTEEKLKIKRGLVFLQTFCMSTTLFLSLLPAINETLTRLPLGHPLAASPESPVVQASVKILLVLYLIGLVLQFIVHRKKTG